MKTAELDAFSRDVAGAINGKVQYRKQAVWVPYECHYLITGGKGSIRCKAYLGMHGGYVEMSGYKAPCAFDLAFFGKVPTMGLVRDITSVVHAPVRTFSDLGGLYVDCIKSVFIWDEWGDILKQCGSLGEPLLVADSKCEMFLPYRAIPNLVNVLPALLRRFSDPPFVERHDSGPVVYGNKPGVNLDEARVPEVLRHLIPLAVKWSILDEREILPFALRQRRSEVRQFLAAFESRLEEIEAFCRFEGEAPVPDEIVLFEIAFHAYAELYELRGVHWSVAEHEED